MARQKIRKRDREPDREEYDESAEGELAMGSSPARPSRKLTKRTKRPPTQTRGKGRVYTYDD